MPQFRKKPVVIEAIQWTGSNANELVAFAMTGPAPLHGDEFTVDLLANEVIIKTLESSGKDRLHASVGSWIIKGVQGEFYPCAPDIFQATYEAAGLQLPPSDLRTWHEQQAKAPHPLVIEPECRKNSCQADILRGTQERLNIANDNKAKAWGALERIAMTGGEAGAAAFTMQGIATRALVEDGRWPISQPIRVVSQETPK